MIVTINTDASLHHGFSLASYSFWIACNAGRLKGSGVLKGVVATTPEAEIKAILNALHNLKYLQCRVTKIIFNTDSVPAIDYLTGKVKAKKRKEYVMLKEKFIFLIGRHQGATIEFRHVKAHKNKNADKRSWVNDWCDKAAKIELKQAVIKRQQDFVKVTA